MKSLVLLFLSASLFAKVPPTKLVTEVINFEDDLNFSNMVKAIDRHLVYFNRSRSMDVEFKLGSKTYQRSDLKATLVKFKELVNATLKCQKTSSRDVCQANFSSSVNKSFEIYRPVPKKDELGFKENKSRFTAYYSPSLKGSKTKTDIFKNPIYKKPKKKEFQKFTREEIEYDNKLANKNLELFYVSDSMFDIWLLHVEGGGVIEEVLPTGKIKKHYISYNGTNGQKFNMLSTYMLEKKMITKEKRSLRYQRKYIEDNPKKEREIISSCKSYVYFKATRSEPLGVKSIPLTMNRSMASDKKLFNEYGFISFINVSTEDTIEAADPLNKELVKRFFINQDTGGAIKGNARGDLYMGYGKEAAKLANNLHALGDQYLLILKKEEI